MELTPEQFRETEEHKHFYYRIYDLVCKHCNICHSDGHDPEKVIHTDDCPLYKPNIIISSRMSDTKRKP